MLLSIVVPAWQEARRMGSLARGVDVVRRALPYPVEVVVVDDGSTDGTAEQAERAGFRVIRQGHRGRGAAARAGMLAATGMYRMLVDAEWSMPPEQVLTMLPPVLTGFDVAIASRFAKGATLTGMPVLRRVASRSYSRVVQAVLLPDFADTRCAFKCFRAEAARAIFSRTREDGWGMDVEVLALAESLGIEVIEVPIDWRGDADTRLTSLRDAPGMFTALLRIRGRLAAGSYARAESPVEDEFFEAPHPEA